MADIQDFVKQLEEERKKALDAELKEKQKAQEQQKKDAKILSDAQKGLVQEKISQQKKEQEKQEELKKAQEKFDAERKQFESETNSFIKRELGFRLESAKENLEQAQTAYKEENVLLQEKITALKDNASIVRQAIAKQKEHQATELKNLDAEKKKQEEIQKKKELIQKLEETQLKGFEKTLLGANKAFTGLGDTLSDAFGQTTIGKVLSFGADLIGGTEDTELETQKKELAKLEGKSDTPEKPEEKQQVSKILSSIPFLNVKGLVEKQEQRENLLNPKTNDSNEPQKVEIAQENANTPQKVEIVTQPQPEKDLFAEEKAKESSQVQSEQAETQERMADSLEQIVSNEENQTVKVEGKDTGILGKIASGDFNPLKSLQGIVKGIFKVIQEFINGIGKVLQSALKVVEKLVEGIGRILHTIIDIVGKGFVKLMTFAGQGIAALFRALGSIPPQALLIGAAAIGVLTLAFMGLGKGLQMMTPAIKELANIPLSNFLELAGGLAVLAVPLTAFGVAAAVATPGILGLSLGVGALGLALKVLAPAIETIIPPITNMLSGFGDFLSKLQVIVSNFFTTIGDFITTVGTVISDFISNFAQSMVLLGDANFMNLALGFSALGVALAAFGIASAIAIPSLTALGNASSGLADLVNVPPDKFDALRESFKLLGKAVKEFAKDAKGLGNTVVAMGALSVMPFAKKLLDVQLARTETRDVIDNFKGGVAEAIQPVDIVSFSGAKNERSVEMLKQASETMGIRDSSAMQPPTPNLSSTSITSANSVTKNSLIVQESPIDNSFRASTNTF